MFELHWNVKMKVQINTANDKVLLMVIVFCFICFSLRLYMVIHGYTWLYMQHILWFSTLFSCLLSSPTVIDVARQTHKFYLQANLLLRNFRHCSDQVKCVLFQTYCTNLYCCQLWFNSTKSSLKKLSTSYNSVLRRLLGISKPYSGSKMFVSRCIPTLAELLCTSIYRFAQRIEQSLNCIIGATLLPLVYISSPIRWWWFCILYVK